MQALLHRHVAVADDRAAQIVARPGLESALAGVIVVVTLDDEVLGVDIAGVGGHPGYSRGRVLVGTGEVADVA